MKASDILKKGFFPKEFPSIFDSSSLDKSLRVNAQILDSAPKISHSIKTSIPKESGFRRNITIPNPKQFTLLAKFIDEKSDDISRFFDLSHITLSKAVIGGEDERAIINSSTYEELLEQKIIKGFASKYIVTTDISKFYNSIYTHSIPWALHGKSESKRDRTDALWGNKLDRLVRNMQDGQTLGIPTGPDTSRIISEIIGVAIDKKIHNSFQGYEGIRYIDDFFFFVDSFSEAESLLVKIKRALREFELSENENKSFIQAMPSKVENLDLQRIQNYKIRKGVLEQKSDIIHMYNIAIDIDKNNSNKNPYSYFLAKIIPIKIHQENWDIVEAIILQTASAETKNLMLIAKILVSYKSYGYNLNLDKIKISLFKILQQGVNNNFGFEITWVLWILSQLEIQITEQVLELPSLTDPLAIISFFIAKDNNLYTPELDIRAWNNLLVQGSLYDEAWLLAYEAESRGWLNNQEGIKLIDLDPYFRQLHSLGVSFLNLDRVIIPIDENELIEETDTETRSNLVKLLYEDW